MKVSRRSLVVVASLTLATLGLGIWSPFASAGPGPDIQLISYPPQVVDWVACYDTEPTTSLTCPSGSQSISTAGVDVSSYEVINLPWGARDAKVVTYTAGDWGDPHASLFNRVTIRTAVGCGSGDLDVLADASSSPTGINNWPSTSNGWVWLPLVEQPGAASNLSYSYINTTKATPPSFPASVVYTNNFQTAFRPSGSLALTSSTYPGWGTAFPVSLVSEHAPYSPNLRVAQLVTGNPFVAPANVFQCEDSPHQSVLKYLLTAPSQPGYYPRWTTMSFESDVRNGTITQLLDVQCVNVGGYSQSDTDGDCLENAKDPNPVNANSDGDQLPDGVEVAFGSSPAITDSDGDGANDFDELFAFTDPWSADTDLDGSKDKQDLLAGFPADASDDDNCPAIFNPDQANTDALPLKSFAQGVGGSVLAFSVLSGGTQLKLESAVNLPAAPAKVYIEGQELQYGTVTTSSWPEVLQGLTPTPSAHAAPAAVVQGTKLNQGTMPIGATTITVHSTAAFGGSTGYLFIDGEYVHYSGKTGTTQFAIDQRGLGGTAEKTHSGTSVVVPAIDSTTTAITVDDNSRALLVPGHMLIDDELISFTGVSGTSGFTGVQRGAGGTLPKFHHAAPVFFLNDVTSPAQDHWGDACDQDDDNDALLDLFETSLMTSGGSCSSAVHDWGGTPSPSNPLNADSDRDLGLDGEECRFATNPLDATSRMSGTMTAGMESFYRTQDIHLWGGTDTDNPDGDSFTTGVTDNDSDNDGVLDLVEIRFLGTNPTNDDSDSDGCPDGRETASINADRLVDSSDINTALERVGSYRDATTGVVDLSKAIFDFNRDGQFSNAEVNAMNQQFGGTSCGTQVGATVQKIVQ